MSEKTVILDLCGGSGSWSAPYVEAGYDVRVIDPHRKTGDVRLIDYPGEVYGILAAPPCTQFAVSGARWWKGKDSQPPLFGMDYLTEALSIADACLRLVALCKPVWWALENPVGRLSKYYGPPVMTFDPCDYGDPWTKKTALWGTFCRPLSSPVEPTETLKIRDGISGPNRARERAKTPPGFARAFFEANP